MPSFLSGEITQLFATYSLWVINLLYTSALIPQIVLNFRRKTVEGFSNFTLGGYYSACLSLLFYAFCLDLPNSYLACIPIATLLTLGMIAQRLYYDGIPRNLRLMWFTLSCIAFVLLALPVVPYFQWHIGQIFGWISAFLWTVYLIPQGIRIYTEQSVEGISFWFMTLIFCGALAEVISAVILNLPWATILIALRGILIYLGFCGFLLYLTYGQDQTTPKA